MIVKTRNSTYEIEGVRIRCLATSNPGRDTGITSEWRMFEALIGPRVGNVLRIIWGDKATTTSTVIHIEDEDLETGWTV